MVVFCLSSIVSAAFTGGSTAGFRFCIYYTLFFLIAILLANEQGWQNTFISALYFLVAIHAVIILWSAISWDSFLTFAKLVLMPDVYNDTYYLKINYGGLAGITGQVGTAAVYMSIGICISFSHILFGFDVKNGDKRYIHYLLLLLFIACALMTGKRSVLVFAIVVLFLGFIINNKTQNGENSIVIYLLILCVLSMIVYLVSKLLPDVNNTFNRFMSEPETEETYGRNERYLFAWKTFLSSPIWGIGTWKIYNTHNDYLQLLATNGIVGGLSYVIAYGMMLWMAIGTHIKRFSKARNNQILHSEEKEQILSLAADRKSTRLNSSHPTTSRMPSSA